MSILFAVDNTPAPSTAPQLERTDTLKVEADEKSALLEEADKMPVAELYRDKTKRKEFSDRLCKLEFVRDEELILCKKDGSINSFFGPLAR